VTFGGNIDAQNGIDITNAPLTIDNQAITQTTGGQVTFAGNVDATGGLDVTGADLTTNQAITHKTDWMFPEQTLMYLPTPILLVH